MQRYKEKILSNEKAKIIFNELLKIWNFEDWALGILNDAKTEIQQQEIIDLINSGEKDPGIYSVKALNFSGIIGIPDEEFDREGKILIDLDEELEYIDEKNQNQAL